MVVNTCVVQQQKEKEQAHSRRQRAAGAQRGWGFPGVTSISMWALWSSVTALGFCLA